MGGYYVIGVDFGSDSARAIIVNTHSAATIAEASMLYPRWSRKEYCDISVSQYRQHPRDHLEVLESILKIVIEKAGGSIADKIVGIAVDATGSTVCPVDKEGRPLALSEEFSDDPDAMFHLWKDHTAVKEAQEIQQGLSSGKIDYTQFQGEYSAEWFWAKILHTTRKNRKVKEAAYTWVEHSDWIAGILAGKIKPDEIVHGACAAGHKALWNSMFGGLPSRECLSKIDPYLGIIYDRYSQMPKNAGEKIGAISQEWAEKLGLSDNVSVAVGSFDAHAGAVGVGISERTLVKVVGTSTVDMLIIDPNEVKGKRLSNCCGLAENSIVPGFIGCESGQSAFGDTYAWYKKILMWPLENMDIPEGILSQEKKTELKDLLESRMIRALENAVEEPEGEDTLIALDWFNGRRYPRLNENVKSAMNGLTLGASAPDVFRALVKGTIFGSKHIYDSFMESGIKIDRVVCVGGIASKSEYIMQMMSDVLNIPIMVSSEKQSCARGACVFASVGAGIYESVQEAQRALCEPYHPTYFPHEKMHLKYMLDYKKYLKLGEYVERDLAKEEI